MRLGPVGRHRLFEIATLIRSPSQLKYLRRAWRDRGQTPLETRRPWWPYDVVSFIRDRLPEGSRVFEYGGGGSSLWLHDLGADVITVEHSLPWFEQLEAQPRRGTVILREPTSRGTLRGSGTDGYFDSYVATISAQPGDFDLVIIDGRARIACLEAARDRVRPGGMLLLDDAQREKYQIARSILFDWHVYNGRGLKAGFQVATTTVWSRPTS